MQNTSGGMLEDDFPTVTGIDALYVVPPTSRKSLITSARVANVVDKQKLSAEEISSSVFRPSESLATRGDGGDRGGSQLLHVSQSCSSAAPIPNHYSKSSISSSDSCSSSRKKASHLPLCYRANQDDCYQESPRNSSCSAVFEKSRCTSMVMLTASNASVSGVNYRDQTVTNDNDNHQHHYYWNPFPSASDGDSFPYAARSPCSPDALLGAYADAGRSAPHAARLASSKWDDAEKWLTANINGCRGFTTNSLRSLGKSCHARTMPSPSIEPNHDRPPHKSTKLRSSSNMQRAHPSFAWSNEQSRALNASNSLSHDAHQYGVVAYSPNHMFANNGDPMITRHVARCMIDAGTCGTSISPNHHCHGRALAAEAVRCTSCGGLRWATPCNFNPGYRDGETPSQCPFSAYQAERLTMHRVSHASLRDVSTEMTPLEGCSTAVSRYSSFCTSPSRNNTPAPSSNALLQHGSSPRASSNTIPALDLTELSRCHRAKLELNELVWNGKGERARSSFRRFSTPIWSSQDTAEDDLSRSLHFLDMNEERAMTCWQKKDAKFEEERLQREEARIHAWEKEKKAKADAQLRKLEAKLEKERFQATDKIMRKLLAAQRQAVEIRMSIRVHRHPSRAIKVRGRSRSPLSVCGSFLS